MFESWLREDQAHHHARDAFAVDAPAQDFGGVGEAGKLCPLSPLEQIGGCWTQGKEGMYGVNQPILSMRSMHASYAS